jgi:hypothetical protein
MSCAPAGDARPASGQLLARGTKFFFDPAPPSGKPSRAGQSSFIWDATTRQGFLLSEALQGYAPIAATVGFTNLVVQDLTKNGSVLDIDKSFRFRLPSTIQKMIHVTRRTHVQPFRDPFHRYRRLRAQSRRHRHLLHVTLRSSGQFFFRPTPPFHFFRHDPFGVLFHRLLPFRPIMLGTHPLLHLPQQLLPKRLRPQTPSPPQLLVIRSRLPRPQFLQRALQLPPPRRAVLGNVILPQQPLHPQPRPPLPRTLQVFRPTAPPILPQRLLRLQQLRPRRIQMHVIAHRPQIPAAAAIHHQRLVATAEQMSEQLVPPVEPARVRAQKPLHPGHQIPLRRFHHQMKMVGHEAQGLHLPAGFPAGLAQRGEKPLAIL